jgi:hypothetical protein
MMQELTSIDSFAFTDQRILRLLRGQDLELLSRELDVTPPPSPDGGRSVFFHRDV